MMRKFWLATAMVLIFVSAAWGQKKEALSPLAGLKPWEVPNPPIAPMDTIGAPDTVWFDLKKGEKEGEWVLHISLFNDEPLFAFSFPVRYDSLMVPDSASIAGTRISFFETKIFNKKAAVPNTLVVGLFSAMNPTAPPLEPGRGLVLKIYFKAPASRPISQRSIAPIMMPPGLEFSTPKGAPVRPVAVRVDSGPSAVPDKAPSKPVKKPKG